MSEGARDGPPAWYRGLPVAVVLLSFLSFGVGLDRYPQPYADETFYNYPAVRFLEGEGFSWKIHPDAPHGDRIWAYHAPFYPRLQTVTLKLLGVSSFAFRIVPYASAHLAVLTIALWLCARGLRRSGLAVTVLWLGMRSAQEVMWGRMDGVALLFLVVGLTSLVDALGPRSRGWILVCGASLGTAACFHPLTGFCLPVALALLLAIPPCRRPGQVIGLFAGGLLAPLSVLAYLYWPDPGAAIEQFLWNSRAMVSGQMTKANPLAVGFDHLRWSRFWVSGLALASALWILPACFFEVARARRSRALAAEAAPWVCAGLFSAGSMALLLATSVVEYTYYVVFFELWPVVALAVLWETRARLGGSGGRGVRIAVGLLLLCWLPSLAWNAMRFREAVLYFDAWRPALLARKLQALVPASAEVRTSPELFPVARQAGLAAVPLRWSEMDATPPRDCWLVLHPGEAGTGRLAPSALAGRPTVFDGIAYPDVEYAPARYRFLVFGPAASGRP